MKDTDIIKAIAELDGWTHTPGHWILTGRIKRDYNWTRCDERAFELPYLTSLDAIVPVIEKLWRDNRNTGFDGNKYALELWAELNIKPCCQTCDTLRVLKATTRQLCVALLKATGKYAEDQA